MKQFIKYVGLDVHRETIAVAVADSDGGEVRYFGEIGNTPEAIEKPRNGVTHPHVSSTYRATSIEGTIPADVTDDARRRGRHFRAEWPAKPLRRPNSRGGRNPCLRRNQEPEA